MTDDEVEEVVQSEPFWFFMLDLIWLLFKRAVLAAAFFAVGYYYGYCAGWDDLRQEIKQILRQGTQSAPRSGYEETL